MLALAPPTAFANSARVVATVIRSNGNGAPLRLTYTDLVRTGPHRLTARGTTALGLPPGYRRSSESGAVSFSSDGRLACLSAIGPNGPWNGRALVIVDNVRRRVVRIVRSPTIATTRFTPDNRVVIATEMTPTMWSDLSLVHIASGDRMDWTRVQGLLPASRTPSVLVSHGPFWVLRWDRGWHRERRDLAEFLRADPILRHVAARGFQRLESDSTYGARISDALLLRGDASHYVLPPGGGRPVHGGAYVVRDRFVGPGRSVWGPRYPGSRFSESIDVWRDTTTLARMSDGALHGGLTARQSRDASAVLTTIRTGAVPRVVRSDAVFGVEAGVALLRP